MKGAPRVGTVGELRFVVGPNHTIDLAESGMPAVLATPWLVWFLEHAARQAVLPFLEPGESTVGANVEIRHVAPTPVGHAVTCKARVVNIDGMTLSFQLEVHDDHERIARGYHQLQVVQVDRFARRVQRKTGPR